MGTFSTESNAWDGHKFVCEDDFRQDEPCLVYSFGLANEISFEEAMAIKGRRPEKKWG